MTLPLGHSVAEWTGPGLVALASRHLREEFARLYPDAAEIARADAIQALALIPDVVVEWASTPPRGSCELGGVYDGDVEPARITIRESHNHKRNLFTALHEVGHHILWNDEAWQFQILPELRDKARLIEEKIVNDFAASILVPEEAVALHLGDGVSPEGIQALIQGTQASATTCCIRALNEPGQRLVILASEDGHIWYADSNGTPYNPGKRVAQPALIAAIERARESGKYRLMGGDGIRYSKGWADTDVCLDVLLHDGLVIAVVTSTRPSLRGSVSTVWHEVCEACGAEFAVSASSGQCTTCGDWKCPDCRGCQCTASKAVYCRRCFLALPTAEASKGMTVHEECE